MLNIDKWRAELYNGKSACLKAEPCIQVLDLPAKLPWIVFLHFLIILFVWKLWQLFLLAISKLSTGSRPCLSLCPQVLAQCLTINASWLVNKIHEEFIFHLQMSRVGKLLIWTQNFWVSPQKFQWPSVIQPVRKILWWLWEQD